MTKEKHIRMKRIHLHVYCVYSPYLQYKNIVQKCIINTELLYKNDDILSNKYKHIVQK